MRIQQTGGTSNTDPHWHDYTALIAIDRPKEYNSYLLGTMEELSPAYERAMAHDSVQFVVMSGTGDKAFCTGEDVHEYAEIYNKYPWGFWNWGEHYGRVFDMILHCGMPVIARIPGAVAGGGWEFVACCDPAIASENARFISPGPRVGMTSIGGLSQWLPLHMSIKKSAEVVFLSTEMNAQEAFELGVVNAGVSLEKLDDKVEEFVDRMITLSPSSLH